MRLIAEIVRDMIKPMVVILLMLLIMAIASACTLNLIKIDICADEDTMKQCADKTTYIEGEGY